ncbi:adenylate/guanylate cyclase domain-containing protein [bacterium]|nr:MAG: adenylate/guanylate cyclase domain-containing protein [bacterium]
MGAPTGNVTLVFTDIEGSTRLWERYGDAFKASLDAHNQIIRKALAAHSGYEVKTEGDAFFAVFARPIDAALFSLDVQRELPGIRLSGEDSIRVRIGLHSGEPLVEFDPQGKADYFGPAVNRAARISAAGHGGQTLLSGAMVEPLREVLSGRCEFHDLGEFRLRGLDEPERLVQMVPADAAVKRFGPLRALADTPTNLPAQTTTFVGRDKELRELRAMLLGDEARRAEESGPLESISRQPGAPDTNQVTREVVARNRGSRLITLTGPGGCGKTRLALALAASVIQHFPSGVWFADLGDARDESDLCRLVMESLGGQLRPGKASPAQQVAWALEQGHSLLVLDTFEHLSRFAPALSLWLRTAPRLRVSVTSRERLRVEGEAEYPVSTLATPSMEAHDVSTSRLSMRVSGYPAVQLFLERASQAKPGFVLTPQNAGAVAEICHRLDGMPLALELAAARLNVLSPQQLAARLEKGFDLIASKSRDKKSTRQTNLRNTIEWSYSLLDPWEKTAFLQLSYFAGAFSLESAEAIIDLSAPLDGAEEAAGDPPEVMDVVFSLRDKSLLALRGDDEKYQFEMLGLIRVFTQERFAKTTSEDFRHALARRHAAHYLERAEALHKLLDSPMSGALKDLEGWGMHEALKAIDFCLASGDMLSAVRLYLAASDLLARATRFREQFDKALAVVKALREREGGLAAAEADPKLARVLAKLLASYASACMRLARIDEGRAAAREALEVAKRLHDAAAEAAALSAAGMIEHYAQNTQGAIELLERSIEVRRKLGDRKGEAGATVNLAIIHERLGEYEKMRALLQEALNTFTRLHDKRSESMAMNNLGVAYERLGDFARAEELYRGALRIKTALGDRLGAVQSLGNLGTLATNRLDFRQAEEHYLKAMDLARAAGDRRSLAHVLMRLAIVNVGTGHSQLALKRAEECCALHAEIGDFQSRVISLSALCAARMACGDEDGARESARELVSEAGERDESLMLEARLRAVLCEPAERRRAALAALPAIDGKKHEDLAAAFQCIWALDENDRAKARAALESALRVPRRWESLADAAYRASQWLRTL